MSHEELLEEIERDARHRDLDIAKALTEAERLVAGVTKGRNVNANAIVTTIGLVFAANRIADAITSLERSR